MRWRRRLLGTSTVLLALLTVRAVLGFWLPGYTVVTWAATTVTTEQSLLLLVPAGLVAAGGLLLTRWGGSRLGPVLVAVGVGVGALSLLPALLAARTASAEGAEVSWSSYLDGVATTAGRGPDATESFAQVDGEDLSADLWLPPGEPPADGWPALVWVHGGAWSMGNRALTPAWSQWLADERGIAVVAVSYRLAPPARWSDAPSDVACALGWVQREAARLGVDPDRVGAAGASAGGHLVLLAAYADGVEEFAPSCEVDRVTPVMVAALYPPTDLAALPEVDGWRHPDLAPAGTSALEDFLGGTLEEVPRRYDLASPVSHVDGPVPPTLLVTGDRDQIVPPAQSRLLARSLAGAGAEVRLLELPLANHAYDLAWGGVNTQTTRSVLGRFLDEHL